VNFVTDKLSPLWSTPTHYTQSESASSRSAQTSNSFTLTVCLEVILRQNFQNNNRMSLYFNHGTKSRQEHNLKLRISYTIC